MSFLLVSFLLKHNASRISEEDINVAFLQVYMNNYFLLCRYINFLCLPFSFCLCYSFNTISLSQACIHCHENIARTLLEHGAFIDYRDGDHWTAVHFASAYGNKPILNLLFEVKRMHFSPIMIPFIFIQYGADATLLDIDGNFALDYALNVTVKGLIAEEMAQSG